VFLNAISKAIALRSWFVSTKQLTDAFEVLFSAFTLQSTTRQRQ